MGNSCLFPLVSFQVPLLLWLISDICLELSGMSASFPIHTLTTATSSSTFPSPTSIHTLFHISPTLYSNRIVIAPSVSTTSPPLYVS